MSDLTVLGVSGAQGLAGSGVGGSVGQSLRLVDRDAPSNVIFDFDDHLGTVNPSGIITVLRSVGLGTVQSDIGIVKQRGSGIATRVDDDPQVRILKVGLAAWDPAGSLRTLTRAFGELYRILQSDSSFYRLIAWNDGTTVRYLEPIGIEGAVPTIREDYAAYKQGGVQATHGEDDTLTLEIKCQPFVLTDELDSDTNTLLNATLMVEGSTANRPTDWVWSSTSNISAELLGLNDAYQFDIATTSLRDLFQVGTVGAFAPGDVATVSFWARASVAGIARMRAAAEFANSGGTGLGGEATSSQVTLETSWRRITVTTGAAPATTSRIQAKLRLENISATSVTVFLRDAQAEKASAATPFRAGTATVQANPASIYGLGYPVVIDGDAPTPVTFDITAGSLMNLTSMRMGARWNRGKDNTFAVPDFQNATLWVPAAASADGWTITNNYTGSGTAVVTDAGSAQGSALQVTVSSGSNGIRLRRLRGVRTTNRTSLRGEFAVYACVAAQEGDIDWLLQLHYGSAQVDPLPNSEDPVIHTVAGDAGFQIGYEYVFLGVFRASEVADLSAQVLELHVSRKTDSPATAHLNISHLALVPYEQRTRLIVPGGGSVTWEDEDFTTGGGGVVAVAGDPSWSAGSVGDGGGYVLNGSGQAVGIKPGGTGQAYGSGIVEITFNIRRADEANKGSKGYMCRLVDVTGPVTPNVPGIVGSKEITKAKKYKIRVQVTSNHLYQPQVTHRGGSGNRLVIANITKTFIPAVISGKRLVSDPEHFEVTKRDASGNLEAICDTQGQTPFVLEPGRYIITFLPGEISKGNHDDDNVVIGNSFTVRHRYTPRWTQ